MMNNIKILPDPHIGRKFVTGVPLHRLGEREKSQQIAFQMSLSEGDEKYHVCVGDIFDKSVVPNHVLMRVFETYADAAEARPDRHFFLLRGNHDASRDASKVSSFDVLALLLEHMENITIIRDEPLIYDGMGFIPWHPFKTSEVMAEEFLDLNQKVGVIFTHNDVEAFGDKTENLIQTKRLQPCTSLICNGHIHVADEFDRDGVHVIVTGALQPYTHIETPLNTLYRTMTLADFQALDPADYKDVNIRLLLKPGQEMPVDVDCLSLTSKRLANDDEAEQVDLEEFMNLDLGGLLRKRLADNPMADQIMEQFDATETVS